MNQNIVVVGAGKWGINHVRTLYEMGALYGVCDKDQDALTELGPHIKRFRSVEEVGLDTKVKGVVVATPARVHATQGCSLMEAGKHVLIEKPMALGLQGLSQLETAAKDNGTVFMGGHLLLFHAHVKFVVKEAQSGNMGDVLWAYSNRLNFGTVRTVEDALWSLATHDISILLLLAKAMPIHVNCSYRTRDVCSAYLKFESFDSQIQVNWIHPYKEHRFVVIGTRKTFCMEHGRLYCYKHKVQKRQFGFLDIEKGEKEEVQIPVLPPLTAQDKEFVDRVNGDSKSTYGNKIGMDTVRVLVELDNSSNRDGREINL